MNYNCSECVWVELPIADGISMLTGKYYFSPDTKPEVISKYFHNHENILDTNNTRVILWGTSMLLILPGRAGHFFLNATIF
jgi:hypothetical protein